MSNELLSEGTGESGDPLMRVTAYRLALEALAAAREDVQRMRAEAASGDVAAQLLRAVGSVAANIAEGYSRGTAAERRRFYEYALGSARECTVWYLAAGEDQHLPQLERLNSIRRLLLTMVRSARADTARTRAAPRTRSTRS